MNKNPKLLLAGLLTLMVVGCASVNKALDDADKGLAEAEKTLDRVDETVRRVEDGVGSALATGDRLKARAESLAERAANLPSTLVLPRHVVRKGDTLWAISRANYGTGFLWPSICQESNLRNCHRIEVGQIVRYPSPSTVQSWTVDKRQAVMKVAIDAPNAPKK